MHARWWGSTQKTKELKWAISPHNLGGVMPKLPSSFVSTGYVLTMKSGLKASYQLLLLPTTTHCEVCSEGEAFTTT